MIRPGGAFGVSGVAERYAWAARRLEDPYARSMSGLRMRAAAGVVAGALALGIAELLAAFFGGESAPWQVLGASVVDHTPDGLREWAIQTFGTADKTVLHLVMALVAASVAALAGIVERTERAAGSALFALFGAVTAALAISRVGLSAAVPTLLGVAVGVYALRVLTRRIDAAVAAREATPLGARAAGGTTAEDSPSTVPAPEQPAASTRETPRKIDGTGRREVLRGLMIAGGAAVVTGVAGRLIGLRRVDVSGERAAVVLPTPSGPPVELAPGAELRVPGLTPYVTPAADFYRIDTALLVPQVSIEDWSLRIHGMVEREIVLRWDDLANRTAVERLVTLTCVSNPVGGDLVGNALWRGYRIDELLAEAGPLPDADMVLSRSKDGWTAGTPLPVLTDGRDALLAIGMNGEPLPVAHGYPARLVVPGLYGYVSATKWVTELEVTRFDRATAYWTRRGWSPLGPIKTATRIDTPGAGKIAPGRTVIAGVAWAQRRGISAVEVSIDNGPWQRASLAAEQSVDTWRQWVFEWEATAGKHTILARATDGVGEVQTARAQGVLPDGATGYPSVFVRVG